MKKILTPALAALLLSLATPLSAVSPTFPAQVANDLPAKCKSGLSGCIYTQNNRGITKIQPAANDGAGDLAEIGSPCVLGLTQPDQRAAANLASNQ